MIRRFRCVACGYVTPPKVGEKFRRQSVCPECHGRKWKACPPIRSFYVRCRVDGCGRKTVARGLCARHYQRWLYHCADDAPEKVKP